MLNNEIAYAMQMNEDEIKKLGINVNSIKKIADKIERDILKKTSSQNLHNDYKFKDLKSILSKNEIYIDIFQQENLVDGNISYYAFLIKNNFDSPEIVKIGSCDSLNLMIRNFLNDLKSKKNNYDLYDIIFSNFNNYLNGIKTVYFSADGDFNKINLNVLYNAAKNKYIMNEFEIINLNCIDDVFEVKSKDKNKQNSNSEIVLFGNPKFNLTEKEINHDTNIDYTRSYDCSEVIFLNEDYQSINYLEVM